MLSVNDAHAMGEGYYQAILAMSRAQVGVIAKRIALESATERRKRKETEVAKAVLDMFEARGVRTNEQQREAEIRATLQADTAWVALVQEVDSARTLQQEMALEAEVAREHCQRIRATMYLLAAVIGGVKVSPDPVS